MVHFKLTFYSCNNFYPSVGCTFIPFKGPRIIFLKSSCMRIKIKWVKGYCTTKLCAYVCLTIRGKRLRFSSFLLFGIIPHHFVVRRALSFHGHCSNKCRHIVRTKNLFGNHQLTKKLSTERVGRKVLSQSKINAAIIILCVLVCMVFKHNWCMINEICKFYCV